MNPVWNQFSTTQQTQFLQQAGLAELPPPAVLTEAQWSILGGVVGEREAQAFRQNYAGDRLESPALPPPAIKGGDWSSIMAMVAELRAKSSEMQINAASENIQATKESIAKDNEYRMSKLMESIEKMEKSRKSGLFGKIFGWIGAIVGLIGAVVATIATGGAAAPALAIAVMGVGMMVLQETGAMEKIVEFLADNPAVLMAVFGPVMGGVLFGLIESGAIPKDYAEMAIQLAFTVAMLACSVAGIVASGGASATQTAQALFKVIGMVGQIAGGLASIGSGASGVATAAYTYEASTAQADAKELTAWLAKLQALMSEESEKLQELIDKLNAGMKDASDILSDIAGSHQSVVANMGV